VEQATFFWPEHRGHVDIRLVEVGSVAGSTDQGLVVLWLGKGWTSLARLPLAGTSSSTTARRSIRCATRR
jgi:hypothetical protein